MSSFRKYDQQFTTAAFRFYLLTPTFSVSILALNFRNSMVFFASDILTLGHFMNRCFKTARLPAPSEALRALMPFSGHQRQSGTITFAIDMEPATKRIELRRMRRKNLGALRLMNG